jgi:hypothetical protein
MNQKERKKHLSSYLYRMDGITRKSEEDLMEALLKQAGVLSFDRVVIESLGLYQTFDSMEDACDLFEALVYHGHNADLFVGYVMPDGKVFVCDRSRGFSPVYSSRFARIPPRTKYDIEMMKERFLANGWTHTV